MKKAAKLFYIVLTLLLPTLRAGAQNNAAVLTHAMQLYGSEHIPVRPPYDRPTISAQHIKCIKTFSTYKYDSPQWKHSDSGLSAYSCFDTLGRLTETYETSNGYKTVLTYGPAGLIDKTVVAADNGRERSITQWNYDISGRLLKLQVLDKIDPSKNQTQVLKYNDRELTVEVHIVEQGAYMTYIFNTQGEVCETVYRSSRQSQVIHDRRITCYSFAGPKPEAPYRLETCGKTLPAHYRLKEQNTFVNEHGQKLTRMTWITRGRTGWGLTGDSTTWSKTIDGQGHCLTVEEVQYNRDSILTSTKHDYNQLGQLTGTKMYFSKAWTAFEDSYKSEQTFPHERHEHITYTYFRSGLVKSKCTQYEEGHNTHCENMIIEYY